MEIEVRCAHLGEDRDLLLGMMSRHLGAHCDGRRFDWLYRDNPAGPAKAWIAARKGATDAVGMGSVFPRYMYFEGRQATGWIFGDFCLESGARSLGPALQLQRACLAGISSGEAPIAYDLPSRSMLAVYKRMGVRVDGDFVRFAKLLRSDEKIARVLGNGTASSLASACSNWLLDLRSRRSRGVVKLELAKEDQPCGADFGDLAHQVGNAYGTCGVRSPHYLNWRYRSHPYRRYEIISARSHGQLRGYGVVHATGKHAVIVDLLSPEEPVLEFLLRGIAADLQNRGICSLSCPALATNQLARILGRNGFRRREATPVMMYEPSRAQAANGNGHGPSWFLTEGDRES